MPVTQPLPDGPYTVGAGTPGQDAADLVAFLTQKGAATDAELQAAIAAKLDSTTANATYVAFSPNTPAANNGIVVKPQGDTRVGVINWINNSQINELFHLTLGPNTAPASGIIRIGVDNPGEGIRVRNKSASNGIVVEQVHASASGPGGPVTQPGLIVSQYATAYSAVGAVFQQSVDSTDGAALVTRAPVARFQACGQPVAGSVLVEFNDKTGNVVEFFADTGIFRSKKESQVASDVAGFHARQNDTISDLGSDHIFMRAGAIEFAASTGSNAVPTSHWTYRLNQSGTECHWEAGDTAAFGAASTPVVSIGHGSPGFTRLGFFNTAPIQRRAATANATDLATAITAVNALLADARAYGLKAP